MVLYADGQKPAAQKVARDLGVEGVERARQRPRDLAGGADVVVIAGEDRASRLARAPSPAPAFALGTALFFALARRRR